MKILILGSSGMLGSSLYRNLKLFGHEIYGIQRDHSNEPNIYTVKDASNFDSLKDMIRIITPNVVINCIGIIKQKEVSKSVLSTLPLNSMLPHYLAEIATKLEFKLIHFSTDCVFDGVRGGYVETDRPNTADIYGLSKQIGEVQSNENVLTIRTSIIGHGIKPNESLLDWFLAQEDKVKGFSKAVFSGLPCSEFSEILEKYVFNSNLYGLYHISSMPINKYDLLLLIKEVYEKEIEIVEDQNFVIDRSLNCERFKGKVGYSERDWRQMIVDLKEKDYLENENV